MKQILLLMLFGTVLNAQTVAVKFYGTNSQGYPPYWPQAVLQDTNPPAGFVLMSAAALNDCIATNTTAYNAWIAGRDSQAASSISNAVFRLQSACDAVAADCAYLDNPNYSFVTNWANLQLGLKYINTNLLHIAAVISNMSSTFQTIYRPPP